MFKFVKLREEHLQMVLDWRIKPEVAQFMLTQVENDLDEQKAWFKKVSTNPAVAYWVIQYQNHPIGLINLAAIDRLAKKCSAGYYIGDMEFRQFSPFVLPYLTLCLKISNSTRYTERSLMAMSRFSKFISCKGIGW
jgi:UDP-4-amino-4,6-dideoxy-N-acetyl-beta-L-altrosamine N-acetyltransferase